jgi:hypothetical protein
MGILLAGQQGPAAEALAEATAEAAADSFALAAVKAAANFAEAAATSERATRREKEGAMLQKENNSQYRGMRKEDPKVWEQKQQKKGKILCWRDVCRREEKKKRKKSEKGDICKQEKTR